MDNFLNINYQNNKEENKKSTTRIESYSTIKGLLSEIYDNLKEKNINVDLKTINLLKKNINIKKTHSINVYIDIKNNNKKKVKKLILKNNIKNKSKSFKQITNNLHLNSIFNNNTNNNNNKNNNFTLSKSLEYKIKTKHLFLKNKQSKKILEKRNFKFKRFKTTSLINNIKNKLEIKKNSNLISTKKTQNFSKKFKLTELQISLRNNLFNYNPEKNNENNSEDDNAKEKRKKRYPFYINNICKYRKLERKNKIYDSMSEEEFESEEEIENKNKIFLMPNSIVHYLKDFLLILACIYDIFFYTFYIAYYANELEIFFSIKFHKIILIFIDYLYILDFLISFFTAYYDYDEILITNFDKIFFNYINSFGVFDLILSIPINSILIKSINNKSIKYISSYYNKKNLIFLITYIKKLKMIKIFSESRNNILSFI